MSVKLGEVQISHSHQHGHDRHATNLNRLALTLILAAGYMVAEFIGGLITNSLALLADAGHMLSDVAGLAISMFAIWIAQRPPTARRSYGYRRAEILASLLNGSILVAISVYIFVEAFHRFRNPPEVLGSAMLGIAIGGLAINLVGLWILSGGRNENLNVRGAWLHVFTDALGSVGAISSGVLIWAFGWEWADPAASLVIGILVIYSSWRLVTDSVSILMENAPPHIDMQEVTLAIKSHSRVVSIHDLHVWTIASGIVSLSVHVVISGTLETNTLLKDLRSLLSERFGIDHTTIQIEPENFEEKPMPV